MSGPVDEHWRQGPVGVPARATHVAGAIRVDLARLHASWLELAFPRGLRDDHSVVEHRSPGTTYGVVGFWLWAVAGALVLPVVYPLFVVGLATRYYSRRIGRLSAGLGVTGVALVAFLVWGAFTVAAYVSPIAFEGLVAVAIAGVAATVAAVLAMYATRRGGRFATVALGYPFGVTAIFLPPVVASLYSPTLASVVFPNSESLAAWLLDTVFAYGGVAAFVRASFELEGVAHVVMWVGLAFPTGWVLGSLEALASTVRRSATADGAGDAQAEFLRG